MSPLGWYNLENFPQGGQIQTRPQSVGMNLIGRRKGHKAFGKNRRGNQEGGSQSSEVVKGCIWLL